MYTICVWEERYARRAAVGGLLVDGWTRLMDIGVLACCAFQIINQTPVVQEASA